jgi:hypothetical protein
LLLHLVSLRTWWHWQGSRVDAFHLPLALPAAAAAAAAGGAAFLMEGKGMSTDLHTVVRQNQTTNMHQHEQRLHLHRQLPVNNTAVPVQASQHTKSFIHTHSTCRRTYTPCVLPESVAAALQSPAG